MPVLVFLFLNGLDPVVGDVHGHTVVEAITPVFIFGRQTRHAAYFLGDGDGVFVDLMDQFVGKCQVSDSVAVLMSVEVIGVVAEGYNRASR